MNRRPVGISYALVLASLTLASPMPRAIAESSPVYAPECRPIGTIPCSGFKPTQWKYSAICGPQYSTEQQAADWLYDAYFRDFNCSTEVSASGAWLSGGPHTVGSCGSGPKNYASLPVTSSGIEIQNYRPYTAEVTWRTPSCEDSNTTPAWIAKTRSKVCLPGQISASYNGKSYCRGDNDMKAFGQQCLDSRGNPIHCATGNKFQTESDYAASNEILRFARFYNSTGQYWNQTSYFGTRWVTRIGTHWRHSYDRSVDFVASNSLYTAFVYRPDGRVTCTTCTTMLGTPRQTSPLRWRGYIPQELPAAGSSPMQRMTRRRSTTTTATCSRLPRVLARQ